MGERPDTSAAARWAAGLQAWAVPAGILAAAPESPHGFDVAVFERAADEALREDSPSRRRAEEALVAGGAVLDVGCGAGAASLPLAGRAGLLVGVDESAAMLEAFAGRARAAGVAHEVLEGRWPDVAARAPAADVVVCHHVLYNAPDAADFVRALDEHARRRVVVEVTAEHPLAWLRPYWRALHGLERPDRPTVEDLRAVLAEQGIPAAVEYREAPLRSARGRPGEVAAFVRRRLCLPAEREPQVRAALAADPPPRTRAVATLWWEPRRARARPHGRDHSSRS